MFTENRQRREGTTHSLASLIYLPLRSLLPRKTSLYTVLQPFKLTKSRKVHLLWEDAVIFWDFYVIKYYRIYPVFYNYALRW